MVKNNIYATIYTAFVPFLAPVIAFGQLNMSVKGNLTYNENLNDVWGYVDTSGIEYALVGLRNGFSVVSLADPTAPSEVFFESGNNSIWRDIKTWDNHAYVTTEGGGGLLIVDLSPLPGSTNLPVTYYGGNNYQWSSAHNLYIDENGIAYIFGADYSNGGAIMLDLTQDPMAPVEVGLFDDLYLHDGVARGDTLYGGAINDGITAIIDVSNKMSPQIWATWATPSDFSHNNWISGDGDYLFTTDEVEDAYIAAYDIQDHGNVKEVDRFQSHLGEGTIPHNTHWINGYLVTSYYQDGVSVLDVSDPSNMVEVGYYDTSPQFEGNGFSGCWGAYPWLPSGYVLATDQEEGLYVLETDYVRGCYIHGTVTDSVTGNPISNAAMYLESTWVIETSDFAGEYRAGYATAGTYNLTFSKPGYYSKTITGVSITNGQVTVADVELVPMTSFPLSGLVKDFDTGQPIANAHVLIENDGFEHDVLTDASGTFTIPAFYDGNYNVSLAKWGYFGWCQEDQPIQPGASPVYYLSEGYNDDFAFDLGWGVTGDASAGMWERGVPVGTDYNGETANPDTDVADDCSGKAYVTGNGTGGVGDHDVDDGYTEVTSPFMDLSGMNDPWIHYSAWFFNAGGFGGSPNDYLKTFLTNGADTVLLATYDVNGTMSQWIPESIQLNGLISLTTNMRFFARVADDQPGHLAEGGLDHFSVVDSTNLPYTSVTEDLAESFSYSLYPNPVTYSEVTIQAEDNFPVETVLKVFNRMGQEVVRKKISGEPYQYRLDLSALSSGVYFIQIGTENQIHKLIKL